ncbi:HesB/IscA family protein [Methylocella silvestris]|uniref:Iron-sulfur cluster assembly accessory protein n=1 Tax=Methylocella silvestris TaxID=199596 RepID=A0A2J7TLQ1_METSI|nr:iron-sulfur cluster assembly accessory protein [Methylocella silvestris]PNG27698.1 iron-sulfur cluster assembly accessory protein [Methylocella silvestris]
MNITLTPAAHKFVRRLVMFDGGPGSGLRLQVTPGGCSGLSAEFSVQPAPVGNEQVFTQDGVSLFLGAEARLLLDGVTINFVDTPAKTGFDFIDPKKASCGCSSSAPAALEEATLTSVK